MSVHEIAAGLAWIYSTCAGDSTLLGLAPGGIYRGAAPATDSSGNPLAMPVVIFGFQAGSIKTTFNGYRVLTRALFQIKATGLGSDTVAVANAAERLDELFGGPTKGTVTGGRIDSCIGETPLQYDEPAIAGKYFTHFGGIYELLIEKT
jgi:hypothetical protein